MQSPTETTTDPKTTNIRTFDVLERTAKVPIPSKDGSVITTFQFTRPADANDELLKLIALNDSIIRETELTPKGETVKYREQAAYAAHFHDLQPVVTVKKVGGDAEPFALSPSEVHEITDENKARAVGKLYQSKFVVLQNTGASGYAFLFEPKGDEDRSFTTVQQLIGDPTNPSFVLDHYVRRPGKERRESYDLKRKRSFTNRKGDMPKRRLEIDLRPGIELFEAAFVSVSAPQYGGIQYAVTLGGVPFDANNTEHRPAFINAFLPLWKAELADALVDSFANDLQD